MSKVSKSFQWIPDDYVFGSTIKTVLGPQETFGFTRFLDDSKIYTKICHRSRVKIPAIKHLRRIFPESTHIKDKLEILNRKCSKKNLDLAPLVEAPKIRLVMKEHKVINF